MMAAVPVLRILALLLIVIPVVRCDASAQTYGAYAGVSSYDLSGTGTAAIATAIRRYPLDRLLSVDVTLALFQESERFSVQGIPVNVSSTLALPELGVELGKQFGRLRPSIGAGAGAAIKLHGRQSGGFTVHGLLGLSARVSPTVRVGAMGKVRSVRPFRGSMVDFMLGVEIGR
jgi:hypothetical protein